MNGVTVTPIGSTMTLGEGPIWMEKSQSLIYVDIPKGNVLRYFYKSKRTQTLHIKDIGTGGTVGYIVPVEGKDHEFVVGIGRSLASVTWSPEEADNLTKSPRLLATIDLHHTTTRFNDGKCDPAGRLWAGTMTVDFDANKPDQDGSLYKFDSELKSEVCLQKVMISNGLSWNQERGKMYYNDSPKRTVDVFDYDIDTGTISNRQIAFDFKSADINGFPDGMASDVDGNLWVACFAGQQVICIDPTVGKLVRKIELPAKNITSCCFGGLDYSTLFVTSASTKIQQEDFAKHPHSGKVFAVTGTGAKGRPPKSFNVNDQYWKQYA